ncbi:MAG: hypothetical protein WBN53_05915 [Thermodesulfobacteriota bacterium]|jgi:hypothetical protein
MEEGALRKMAIEQYMQGKDPVSIYREMGRSKKWLVPKVPDRIEDSICS